MAKYRVVVEVPGKSQEFTVNAGTRDQAKNKAIRQFCMTTHGVHASQIAVPAIEPLMVGVAGNSIAEQLYHLGG